MKKHLAVLVIFSLFFLGCTNVPQQLDRETAVRLLAEANCFYGANEPGVNVSLTGLDWVISSRGCLGTCSINSITREIYLDENQMCTNGGLPFDDLPIDIEDDELSSLNVNETEEITEGQSAPVFDCGANFTCFQEKYRNCERANVTRWENEVSVKYFEINGILAGRMASDYCEMTVKAIDAPYPNMVGKEMTCTFNPSEEFPFDFSWNAPVAELVITNQCDGVLRILLTANT